MSIPSNKEELLAGIDTAYEALLAELRDLPPEVVSIPSMEGHAKGSVMSVCNLVAYLIGWGELVLKWCSRKDKGLPVDFPETGYRWNQLGLLAQKFYRDYEEMSFPQLLQLLATTESELVRLVRQRTDHELYHQAWHGDWILGRIVQLNSLSPYKNARRRIRKWKAGRAST
jgi:hypothetical protein